MVRIITLIYAVLNFPTNQILFCYCRPQVSVLYHILSSKLCKSKFISALNEHEISTELQLTISIPKIQVQK
jgi:hypothetical protein